MGSCKILICFVIIALSASGFASAPEQVKLLVNTVSPARHNFEVRLTRRILEVTETKYGAFQLDFVTTTMNSQQARRLMARGKHLNLFASPESTSISPFDNEIDIIETPIMRGLLGYRSLLAKKEDFPALQGVSAFEDFSRFRAGQGVLWADIKVYQYNNIPVAVGQSIANLFVMLESNRFDYFPLGIFEIDGIKELFGKNYPGIAVVPNVIVFYPFPVYYHVPKKQTLLKQRIESGLQIVKRDGSLDKMLEELFATSFKKMRSPEVVLINLPSARYNITAIFEKSLITNPRRIITAPKSQFIENDDG